MKKIVFLFTIITTMNLISCDGTNSKEKEVKQNNEKKEKKSDGQEEDNIELTNYENSKMGFTILVPKKAKVLSDGEYGFTTSQILSDNMNEVNISVNPAFGEISSLDGFKKDLKNFMATNITKAEQTNNGFLAVNEQGNIVSVYYRTGELQAKISVPKNLQSLAEKIAKSVKSTK